MMVQRILLCLSCDSCLHATAASTAAAPMVDDDNNKPVPENHPNPNEAVGNIFGEWGHSGNLFMTIYNLQQNLSQR